MKKAQFSTEFIFTISIVIFIFVFLLAFTLDKKSDVEDLENLFDARDQCYKLSSLVHISYVNGDGTKVNMNLLNDVDIISGSSVNSTPTLKVYFKDDVYSCIMSYDSINNLDTILRINKGQIEIENINNTIFIREI